MENFYEQFIATKENFMYKLSKIGMILCWVLAVVYLIFMNGILSIISGITACAFLFAKKNFYVEYEYEFTAGEIDISKILDKKKRKKVISFDIRNIEIMAPENSDYIKGKYNNINLVVKNCFNEKDNDKTVYDAVLARGAEKLMIRFVPDKQFVDYCFKINPRNVKKIN